ncbi:MAG: hypothetical protein JXR19_02580 [Bacteroidia bacterium]
MSLSHTIPTASWALAHLRKAFPQLARSLAFSRFMNGALYGTDELDEINPKQLKKFIPFVDKANTGWYALPETPLSNKKKLGQIGLEGELERDFLFIRDIQVGEDHLSLLLQFKPFIISSKHYMTAAEKKVIEQSVKGMLEAFLHTRERDKEMIRSLVLASDRIKSEFDKITARLKHQDRKFEETLRHLMDWILSSLETEFEVGIKYDQGFAEALKDFNGDFEDLSKHLSTQVSIEAAMAKIKEEDKIKLSAIHLQQILQSSNTKSQAKTDIPMALGRLAKAHNLLDRYELSAASCRELDLSIIGKNIGAQCIPPISNAAITDALSKNSKKIFELFERYPDKWPIIRSEFRSVANIIEKESLRRSKAS